MPWARTDAKPDVPDDHIMRINYHQRIVVHLLPGELNSSTRCGLARYCEIRIVDTNAGT